MHLFQVLTVGLVSLVLSAGEDPLASLESVLGTTAPPVARLDDEAWSARSKSFPTGDKPEEWYGARPFCGVVINMVTAGSTAQRLGFAVRDEVYAFDDRPLLSTDMWEALRGRAGEQRVALFTPKTKALRTVSIPPGLIGVNIGTTATPWAPLVEILADPSLSGRQELLLAAAAWPAELDLVETALARAATRGADRTWVFPLMMCKLRFAEARYRDCLAWGRTARATIPAPLICCLAHTLVAAALANGYVAAANDLIRSFAEPGLPEVGPFLKKLQRLKETERLMDADPFQSTAGGTDLTTAIIPLRGQLGAIDHYRTSGTLHVTSGGPGHSEHLVLGPRVPDLRCTCTIRTEPVSIDQPRHFRSACLQVVEVDPKGENRTYPFHCCLTTGGCCGVKPDDQEIKYRLEPFGGRFGAQERRVELVVIGRDCALRLDGVQVLRIPVPRRPNGRMELDVVVDGVIATINDLRWFHVGTRPFAKDLAPGEEEG